MTHIKHSELPWDYIEYSFLDSQKDPVFMYEILGKSGEVVFGEEDIPPSKQDAEFITLACNCHYYLLEALECSRAMDFLNCEGTSEEMREWAFKVLEKCGFERGGAITYQQFVCQKTDAAIAKAAGAT